MSEKFKNYGASGWYQLAISAVNGAFGDFMEAAGNGLAIAPGFYKRGQRIEVGPDAFVQAHETAATPLRLVVFLHGLGCNERVWEYPSDIDLDYGTQLASDFPDTRVFYARYNTGLPIPVSGEAIAELVEFLYKTCPRSVSDITLIGHSMGGLVSRSAFTYALDQGMRWPQACERIVTLGTPHTGAPLEKLADWSVNLLRRVPSEFAQTAADIVNARSQGIKDLKDGTVHEMSEDLDTVKPPSLPEFFVVAGTLTNGRQDWISYALGDGLVRTSSALGRFHEEDGVFQVQDEHCVILRGLAHNSLAHHEDVYAHIKEWFGRRRPATGISTSHKET